ncbi:DUF222 domain-containing protein [Microbacter sp. GSS18]|nr:DUF222 domain-containing protein [Microbacter sp. GSS18]
MPTATPTIEQMSEPRRSVCDMTNPLLPLGEAVDAARRVWRDGRDPAELSSEELALLTDELTVAQRHMDAAKARVAREVARKSHPDLGPEGFAKVRGFRSPTTYIATTTGVTTAEAARLIEVGEATSPREGFGDEVKPPKYPAVARALEQGRIGVAAAGAIVGLLDKVALRTDPETLARAEADLVEKARQLSMNDLHRVLARAEAWLDPRGVADRESEMRRKRSLHIREGRDGLVHISAVLDPEHGAVFKTAIEQIVTSRLRAQRERATARAPREGSAGVDGEAMTSHGRRAAGGVDGTGGSTGAGADGRASHDSGVDGDDRAPSASAAANGATSAASAQADAGAQANASAHAGVDAGVSDARRSIPQMQAEALIHLIEHGMSCDADLPLEGATVVVRMTLEDLESGDGYATIDGLTTPVSVQTARRMAAGGAVIPCVLGGDSEILDWGRKRRLFTPAQKMALVERDGGCAMCGAPPGWTKTHHIRWWQRDAGPTDLSNGVLLCESCHHRVHDNGWEIRIDGARRDSAVWLIPPADVDAARTPRLGGRALYDFAA